MTIICKYSLCLIADVFLLFFGERVFIKVFVLFTDNSVSYEDACAELRQMYDSKSTDVPRIIRLLCETLQGRRNVISRLNNADASNIIEHFPHLGDPKYVSEVIAIHKF